MLRMIFACDEQGGIGRGGQLPWRQRTDLQHFKSYTEGKCVVMGRKTWESLPKALPGRRNIVMTRQSDFQACETLDYASVLELAEESEVVIIGGGEIYASFIHHVDEISRTIVHTLVEEADTFAPEIPKESFYLHESYGVSSGEFDQFDMTFELWKKL